MNSIFKKAFSAAAALMLSASSGIGGFAQESGGIDGVTDALHDSDVVENSQYEKIYKELNLTNTDYDSYRDIYDPNYQPQIELGGMPEKFDLRDVNGKNYVSEVKLQDPWSTCWSFGTISAAETSLASAQGYDYNSPDEDLAPMLDLSERHLSWFALTPLPDNAGKNSSQAGEGLFVKLIKDDDSYIDCSAATEEQLAKGKFESGGFGMLTVSLFSAGIGPVLEEEWPYGPNEDPYQEKTHLHVKIVTFDETGFIPPGTSKDYYEAELNIEDADEVFAEKAAETGLEIISLEEAAAAQVDPNPENAGKVFVMKYLESIDGDWSVEESSRFGGVYELTDGNLLPEPCCFDEDHGYVHNPYADAAIKSELLKGRGVSVAFRSDQSLPGDPSETPYMNFIDKDGEPADNKEDAAVWAHYTYDADYDPEDPESVNKVIIYDHMVCIVGYDDTFPKEYFNDPKGTIGGDGAWIARNSWGSTDNSAPYARNYWGNNGDGYFYISYYDQSLSGPESFVFETDPEEMMTPRSVDMYDFMLSDRHRSLTFDSDIAFSNVFTAETDCTLRYVGIDTVDPESDVTYKVYLLGEDAKNPEDGRLACTASEHFTYAGFHRADLGTEIPLRKGDKYSVVVSVKSKKGSKLIFSREVNSDGFDYYTAISDAAYEEQNTPEKDRLPLNIFVGKGVVNKGESYLCAGGEWADWADVTAKLKELDADVNNSGFDYDNFPIKTYPETALLTVMNYTEDEDKVYSTGDVLNGVVYIENIAGVDLAGVNLEIGLTVGGKPLLLGENNSDAVFDGLKAGEKHLIRYSYTVTEEDAAAGRVVSEARLRVNGEYGDYSSIVSGALSYEVKAAPAQKPADSNPATGAAVSGILGAAALLILAARRKR